MVNLTWYMVWYMPGPNDHVAYMTLERIAECGGLFRDSLKTGSDHIPVEFVNQGVAVLIRWCRLNCTTVPEPVNVRGKTGFVFTNNADAILFKLTWG